MIHREKQKHSDDEDVIKELCVVNGVSYERIAKEGSNVISLEMFFSGFPRMVGLSFFPRLCFLTIVGQNIKHIKGLECCPLLQDLWVVECRLTVISGLQRCAQLKKLYLYDNQIYEIKNLELLINLEVLWLNNNCISQIQGLNTLQNLKELNLADNIIEKIGHNLDPNVSLQDLNLSGNKISSFKELTLLACLPHLRVLSLRDPTSTPNPVCLLCNYATHVLYHNPGLQQLDSYDVSSKQVKEAAESTVMKKMMYYNMRVRTAQRNLAGTRLSLIDRKKTLLQLPEDCIRTLSHALKNLERELSKVQAVCKNSTCMSEDAPGGPTRLVDDSSSRVDPTTDIICDEMLVKIEALKERLALWRRRLHEIEVCYQRDLAQATNMVDDTVHFLLMELESVGNIRLEEGCSTDPWFNACRDLLLSRFSHSDYRIHGITGIKIDRVIRVFNCTLRLRFEDKLQSLLASTDPDILRRLDHLFYAADPEKTCEKEDILGILEEGFKTADQYEVCLKCWCFLSVGQIIISKVYVGHSMAVQEGDPVDRGSYDRICSVYRKVNTKRRQWFVFDNELVLPEYIVYFQYITGVINYIFIFLLDDTSNNIILDKEVLNMEPVLKAQPKLLSLDDKILLNVASANVLSQITVLNLHGNSLNKMKEISCLTALRHLTISFNEFTRLDDISHMPNLEFLDVSFNRLVTLEGLRGLGHLKQLDVRWNSLSRARENAVVLRRHTPALLKLDTRYNPWKRAVRMTILGRLTTLTHLDDVMVTEEEAADAVAMAAESKINQVTNLQILVFIYKSECTNFLFLQLVQKNGISIDYLQNTWSHKPITALNLDSQRIPKLINLSKMVNLRWASFNDNDLSKVEGLESCQKLEELSLNNNSISTLSGLSKLHCLIKLSVDSNRLSTLDASVLDQLPNLSFLSVENNCISSLHGIQRVRSLLELYIGNNKISVSRDIYYLKGLTNLIILNLYGNPLVEKLENYRIYVVFHLSSLRALDGTAVVSIESESAKEMFGGRLTSDMVAEKLGHINYTDITYLTLQSCSLRIVDLSPSDLFSSLHSINLDHNNLTSFSGLIYLPNIKSLCLNYNHIESILPRQRTYLTNRQILHNKVHSSGYGQQSLSKGNRETWPTGSLEPLMGSLEVLHLSHNGISNMANLQLSRLTNLKALFLQGNEISHVEGLEGLHQLRELVLDRNRIKALAENSFIAQNILLELHLAENRIRELNHLDPLTELRKLFIGMNKLQDITELDKLEVLPSLTELSVVGNPVSIISVFVLNIGRLVLQLSQLQVLDGVMVTLEERTRAELFSDDSTVRTVHTIHTLSVKIMNKHSLQCIFFLFGSECS
uniref:Leucine rich repeat containing 9 n=1 Tax=Scophthalmus maximus TaxID=52904 RepID=A0A8D3DG26_SCOMX